MKHRFAIACIFAFTVAAHAQPAWRTFTSSDGKRTFEGRLTGYNSTSQTVSVENRSGKSLQFKEDLISSEDRDYVRDNLDKLPPDISLDVRFETLVDRGETERGGDKRTSNSSGGYKITLKNYSPIHFSDVKIDYLIIYHKDAVGGKGVNQVLRGTSSTSLLENSNAEVETKTVSLSSFFQKGSVSLVGGGGGCRSCGPGGNATISTPPKRSKDYMVGCVAQIKVNGHVVTTTATTPNLISQYEAEFNKASTVSK